MSEWRARIAASSSRFQEPALDLFVERPYWTVGKLAQRLDVAFTTAQRIVDRFEAAGIVGRLGAAKRNRIYCAGEALAILEEPTDVAW